MKTINKIKISGLFAVAGLLAVGSSSAAVILATDFTGTSASGTTLSNISWVTAGIIPPAPSLTVNNTTQAAGNGDLFTTQAALGLFAPANNTGSGGEWNTVASFTSLANPIALTDLDLTYFNFNNNGGVQNAVRDSTYTLEIRDSTGAVLGGGVITPAPISTNVAGPQTITFSLAGVTLPAGGSYSVFLQAGDGTTDGNNSSFDAFSLNGEVIPEPSSTALLALAGCALLMRRRK